MATRTLRTVFKLLPTTYQRRVRTLVRYVVVARNLLCFLRYQERGFLRHKKWQSDNEIDAFAGSAYVRSSASSPNPLQMYFDSHTEGRGIWKYKHYFEIYHRHFSKFIGHEVHVLEIGVFSGGSLEMWKHYFGSKSRIYGVDVEEACKAYADDSVEIFIGDQADRNFWTRFKEEVPLLDLIIDDGGHLPHQQMITLEEMLPHLRSGGVYLCEDIHGTANAFAGYISGLSLNLHTSRRLQSGPDTHSERRGLSPTQFQNSVHSVHLYPFVAVIEKTESPVNEFIAPAHGTHWQPFFG